MLIRLAAFAVLAVAGPAWALQGGMADDPGEVDRLKAKARAFALTVRARR